MGRFERAKLKEQIIQLKSDLATAEKKEGAYIAALLLYGCPRHEIKRIGDELEGEELLCPDCGGVHIEEGYCPAAPE